MNTSYCNGFSYPDYSKRYDAAISRQMSPSGLIPNSIPTATAIISSANPLNDSEGSKCLRLKITDLEGKNYLIAIKEKPATIWENFVHLLQGGSFVWTEYTYKDSQDEQTKTVYINNNSLIKRLQYSGIDKSEIVDALKGSKLDGFLLKTTSERRAYKKKLIENFKQVDKLTAEEQSTIVDYWMENKDDLTKKAIAENKCQRIQPKNSGLARTLLVTPEGKLFIILNRIKGKGDIIVGTGACKTVKFCFELTEAKWATHTSFVDEIEYRQEVKFLKKFKNTPNILQLLATDEYKSPKHSNIKKYSLITEYCDNGDLRSVLNKTKLPDNEKKRIFKEIAVAVYEVHKQGCFHRDIKPDNIFVKTVKGKLIPILADFGLSCEKINKLNRFDGSPLYLHPVIAALEISSESRFSIDDLHGKAIDIWALGAMFYEIIHDGQKLLPWEEENKDLESAQKNLAKLAKAGAVVFPKPSDETSFEYLVWKMLQVDPNEQFSLDQVIVFLEKNS